MTLLERLFSVGARRKLQILARQLRSLYLMPGNRLPENGVVVVSLPYLLDNSGRSETFFLQIIHLLHQLGFRVCYYLSSLAELTAIIRSIGIHGEIDAITFIRSLPSDTEKYVLLCDEGQQDLPQRVWRHVLHLHLDLSTPIQSVPNPIYLPFPDRSVGYLLDQIDGARLNQKTMRLFFAGAWIGYKQQEVGRFLGKMERAEIVAAFRNFPATVTLDSREMLEAVLAGEQLSPCGYYFIDTQRFRVPQAEWFRVLSHTHAFLAPPGIHHPLSHNIVEALAVGSVPVTNYPEWFHPRLQDGQNCLTFTNELELLRLLQEIQALDVETLTALGKNALAYYDTHLDPELSRREVEKRLLEIANHTHLTMATEIVEFFPRLSDTSLATSDV